MKLYKINPKYSMILKTNNQLLIIDGDKYKKYSILDKELPNIKKILTEEFFCEQNTQIFKLLLNKKIITNCTNTLSNRNVQTYLEEYTNSLISMDTLKNKKIFIIGLGGIGSEIITHLVGNGIKKITILDFDVVDATNLNRQYLFRNRDITKNKVDLVANQIKEKDPTIIVSKHNKFIDNSNDILNIILKEKIDMVVCAADTPFLDIRMYILDACIKTSTPCIFGGLNIKTGQYGPTFIKTSKMKKYYKKLKTLKENIICNNVNKASFGPTNTIISAYMSIDIIMTLLEKNKYINSLNKIKKIDFITRNDYEEEKF